MAQVQTKSQTAVQEYMDTMLTDLFPSIPSEEPTEPVNLEVVTPETATEFIAGEPDKDTTVADFSEPEPVAAEPAIEEPVEALQQDTAEIEVQSEAQEQTQAPAVSTVDLDLQLAEEIEQATVAAKTVETEAETAVIQDEPLVAEIEPVQADIQPTVEVSEPEKNTEPVVETPAPEVAEQVETVTEKPKTLRYPNAPEWAQEAFDVLLFDVCGLKLAVPMESLGRIIKVEHETNHLIGRPDWFLGAYSEADQRLFVVDTAKYIMPEKGFNLEEEGYDHIVQLQRTQWTLACKNVHTTIRLEPDQVKWRSAQGKRKWLAGTVVEHMCGLLHADSLVELLSGEVPDERDQ